MTLSKLGIVGTSVHDTAGAALVNSTDLLGVHEWSVVVYLLNIKCSRQSVSANGKRDTGAIASARAAEIYGLDILAEKLQVRNF